MVNLIVGLLVAKKIIDMKEAEFLVKELESGVTPSDFKQASLRIQRILDQYKSKELKKQPKKIAKKPIAKAKKV